MSAMALWFLTALDVNINGVHLGRGVTLARFVSVVSEPVVHV